MTVAGTRTDLDFVERFALAAQAFVEAVASSDMRARVATCPGWSSYDLVTHLGNTHAWAATIVETGRPAAEQEDAPRSRRARVVSGWYAAKAEDLCQVLRTVDPATPCWTLAGPGAAAFWQRRQLHETTIHLLDLAGGTRRERPIAPEVAADGVAEVLDVFLPRMHRRGHPAVLRAPVCLVATDTGDAWTVTPPPPGPPGLPIQPRGSATEVAPPPAAAVPLVVGRRHPGVDRVEAPAASLYRLRGHRATLDDPAFAVVGDRDRVAAFVGSRLVP